MSALGAVWSSPDKCDFTLWAPHAKKAEVHLLSPEDKFIPMDSDSKGYWFSRIKTRPGVLYKFRLDGKIEIPDPASKYQPKGLHGPSLVINQKYSWTDQKWKGINLKDYVIYELHVGTFSPQGTFDGILPQLDTLKDLGITALEIMPVAQFPGNRNWGYDGALPYAVQNSYGRVEDLKKLVDTCHKKGMAVILDVVYNHIGPEGSVLQKLGPYFTDRYKTPWGSAINFDGAHSQEVRKYFIENALYWVSEFHFDALRLDAIHAIYDFSAKHFLLESGERIHEYAEKSQRKIHIFAESDLNDFRIIQPRNEGGYHLDGSWNDDFHHVVHTLITGEKNGYYQDFGYVSQLAKSMREGYIYSGEFSESRQRLHGNSSKNARPEQLVVFTQNHDQIGNRMMGERLISLSGIEKAKLAAGVLLLSPYIPLIFMGEEFGETAPFLYFISHTEPALIEAVRNGRREEFSGFGWHRESPDPQSEQTFILSKLEHNLKRKEVYKMILSFYKELLSLRKKKSGLGAGSQRNTRTSYDEDSKTLHMTRRGSKNEMHVFYNFGSSLARFGISKGKNKLMKIFDSAESKWQGPGSKTPQVWPGKEKLQVQPHSFAVYERKI